MPNWLDVLSKEMYWGHLSLQDTTIRYRITLMHDLLHFVNIGMQTGDDYAIMWQQCAHIHSMHLSSLMAFKRKYLFNCCL